MLTAARYASRLIESRGDITRRTFSSILQNVSGEPIECTIDFKWNFPN